MGDFSLHRYRKAALDQLLPAPVIEAAVAETSRQRSAGLHPVLTLGHVALETDVPHSFLREAVARDIDPYREIELKRRSGGSPRKISAPCAELQAVQQWVLRSLLANASPSSSSFAYQQGRSAVQCAQRHVGARWMLKLDLKDFFHSIDEVRVYQVFSKLGYPPLVSFELARLSTRVIPSSPVKQGAERGPIGEYSCRRLGVLPQGAPTSGALSNLALAATDAALAGVARNAGAEYTRYSDDIVFSGTHGAWRPVAESLLALSTATLQRTGLRLNTAKTRFVGPGARKVVLGVLVLEDRLALLPPFRRRLELLIWSVEKHGLVATRRHFGFPSVFALVEHVDGCIAYAKGVDPQKAPRFSAGWRSALRAAGYPF